jgi:uncharacterized membrane protein (UPF0182 family)
MDAFMSVSSDGSNYGKFRLINFDADADSSALSPGQIEGQINADNQFSQQVTLLNQQRSTVDPGPLQIVPIANTVVYVQPYFVKGQSNDSRPILTFVTVSVGGQTVCAPTIDQAIEALASGQSMCVPFTQNDTSIATPDTTPDQTTVDTDSSDLSKLTETQLKERLGQASADYAKAKDPLDLGKLQKAADEMSALVDELNKR